jgi:hypothetical protein
MPAPVATSKKKPTGPTHVYFDTDSAPVGIDNRCSACMSHIKEDFGKLTKTRQAIQGYGGVEVYDVYKGTLKWKIEDDKDVITPSSGTILRPKE